jgi:hypothetical protein
MTSLEIAGSDEKTSIGSAKIINSQISHSWLIVSRNNLDREVPGSAASKGIEAGEGGIGVVEREG